MLRDCDFMSWLPLAMCCPLSCLSGLRTHKKRENAIRKERGHENDYVLLFALFENFDKSGGREFKREFKRVNSKENY